jgi:hypothetical protein
MESEGIGAHTSEEMDSDKEERWAEGQEDMSEEQEDMSEEQEDMCMGVHDWEHEEHQCNGRIDSATYDIHECCHSL